MSVGNAQRTFRFTRGKAKLDRNRGVPPGVIAWSPGGGLLAFSFFLQPLAFAIVIGVGFYPFYLWVRRRVRGPNRSALLATVAVLLIFVLPASLIASAAGAQLIKAAQYLGDRSAQEGGAAAYLGDKQARAMVWLGRYVDVEELRIQDALDNLPGQVSKFLLAAGTGLVGGLAGFAGNAILTFLILFFIFRDGEAATSNVAGILPLGPNQAKRLLTAVRDSIVANLYGILAVGLTQGLLTGAALAVLRVPSALLLGLAAAVCSRDSDRGNDFGLGPGRNLPHGHRTSLERHCPHRVGIRGCRNG